MSNSIHPNSIVNEVNPWVEHTSNEEGGNVGWPSGLAGVSPLHPREILTSKGGQVKSIRVD